MVGLPRSNSTLLASLPCSENVIVDTDVAGGNALIVETTGMNAFGESAKTGPLPGLRMVDANSVRLLHVGRLGSIIWTDEILFSLHQIFRASAQSGQPTHPERAQPRQVRGYFFRRNGDARFGHDELLLALSLGVA
jgi:hypothetical protein